MSIQFDSPFDIEEAKSSARGENGRDSAKGSYCLDRDSTAKDKSSNNCDGMQELDANIPSQSDFDAIQTDAGIKHAWKPAADDDDEVVDLQDAKATGCSSKATGCSSITASERSVTFSTGPESKRGSLQSVTSQGPVSKHRSISEPDLERPKGFESTWQAEKRDGTGSSATSSTASNSRGLCKRKRSTVHFGENVQETEFVVQDIPELPEEPVLHSDFKWAKAEEVGILDQVFLRVLQVASHMTSTGQTGSVDRKRTIFPLNPKDEKELLVQLKRHGINPASYGEGVAKSTSQLMAELEKGDCSLHTNGYQLLRRVKPLFVRAGNVDAHKEERVLVETHRKKADGRVVPRNLLLAVKMQPGESVWDSVHRVLLTEVQLPSTAVEVNEDSPLVTFEEVKTSKSYPGIFCVYHTTVAAVRIRKDAMENRSHAAVLLRLGLPDMTSFNTERVDDKGEIMTCCWAWWDAATFAESGSQGVLLKNLQMEASSKLYQVKGKRKRCSERLKAIWEMKFQIAFKCWNALKRMSVWVDFVLDSMVLYNYRGQQWLAVMLFAFITTPWIILLSIHAYGIYQSNSSRISGLWAPWRFLMPVLCFLMAVPRVIFFEMLLLTKYIFVFPVDYLVFAHMRLRICAEAIFEAVPCAMLQGGIAVLVIVQTRQIPDFSDHNQFLLLILSPLWSIIMVITQFREVNLAAKLQTGGSRIKYLKVLMSLSEENDLAPFGLVRAIRKAVNDYRIEMCNLSLPAWKQLTEAMTDSSMQGLDIQGVLTSNHKEADRHAACVINHLSEPFVACRLQRLNMSRNFLIKSTKKEKEGGKKETKRARSVRSDNLFGTINSEDATASQKLAVMLRNAAGNVRKSVTRVSLAIPGARRSVANKNNPFDNQSSWDEKTQEAPAARLSGGSTGSDSLLAQMPPMEACQSINSKLSKNEANNSEKQNGLLATRSYFASKALGCLLGRRGEFLKEVDFSWNAMGEDGAKCLWEAFREANAEQLNTKINTNAANNAPQQRSKADTSTKIGRLRNAASMRLHGGPKTRRSQTISGEIVNASLKNSVASGEDGVKSEDVLDKGWQSIGTAEFNGSRSVSTMSRSMSKKLSKKITNGKKIMRSMTDTLKKMKSDTFMAGFSDHDGADAEVSHMELVLSGNFFRSGVADVCRLIELAPWASRLRVLRLDGNRIDQAGGTLVFRIRSCSCLEELNLQVNRLGLVPETALSQVPNLGYRMQNKRCSVGANQGPHLGAIPRKKESISEKEPTLRLGQLCHSLTSLDLSDNKLKPDSFSMFQVDCRELQAFQVLRVLDLSSNSGLGSGVHIILNALHESGNERPPLEHLALAQTSLTTSALRSAGLERFKSLQSLVLAYNGLDPEATSVLLGVTLRTTLQAVSLAHNPGMASDVDLVLGTIRTILDLAQWKLLDMDGCIGVDLRNRKALGKKVEQLLDTKTLIVGKIQFRLWPWFAGPSRRDLPSESKLHTARYFLNSEEQKNKKNRYVDLCRRGFVKSVEVQPQEDSLGAFPKRATLQDPNGGGNRMVGGSMRNMRVPAGLKESADGQATNGKRPSVQMEVGKFASLGAFTKVGKQLSIGGLKSFSKRKASLTQVKPISEWAPISKKASNSKGPTEVDFLAIKPADA